MRELIVDVESSTAESLFLRDQDGHEYRLAVTDELRALITRDVHEDGPETGPVTVTVDAGAAVGADSTVDAGAGADGDTGTDADTDTATAADEDTAPDTEDEVTLTPVSVLKPVPDVPDRADEPDQHREPEAAGATQQPAPDEATGVGKQRGPSPAAARERERGLPKPDPLFSNPLTMRPRDIQERIRAGASTQELADEMQVAYSRVEPYAHPVMLERTRMAEIAKKSHPVREDGPAKLTLWEVLAAAFGTRGHSLMDATWDSYREAGNAWVVRVSWRAGLSDNYAEWVLRNHHSSSPTAEARDAVAADLTDPNFMQPVRSLSPISRGERPDEDDQADAPDINDDVNDDVDTVGAAGTDGDGAGDLEAVPDVRDEETPPAPAEAGEASGGEEPEQATEPQAKPVKRRRKSVTPHWEDVLLGVRSNTKRPRG